MTTLPRMITLPRITVWNRPENAVAFFSDVAILAIKRWESALVDEIYDTVMMQLNWNRRHELPGPREFEARDNIRQRYQLFRERWGDGHPVRAAFKLVDGVAMAWHNPERRHNTMRGQARRAQLALADVERLELTYRFRDYDPDGKLDENTRLAFEAAWIAGQRKFAVKLLWRSLQDLAA